MDEPTWVALATERLGEPCDQWLIARAAQGRGYRWLHEQLIKPVAEGGAALKCSYFPIQMRLQYLRPLIEKARAEVEASMEEPTAKAADRAARSALSSRGSDAA
jgi:hypothetical protein